MEHTMLGDAVLTALAGHGLMPQDPQAVYLTGSRARGWNTETSDIDVVIVSLEPWFPLDPGANPVGWGASQIQHVKTAISGRSYDIEYWTNDQIADLLAKVSWDAYSPGRGLERQFMLYEVNCLDRLSNAVSIHGHEVVEGLRQTERDSAFTAMRAAFWRHDSINHCEHAQSQLVAGDVHSATLSARLAFECAVDALLARYGQLSSNPKWRARRFKAVNPPSIDFDRFWTTQTMRDYDALDPSDWIETTLHTATMLSAEVGDWLLAEYAGRCPSDVP